MRLYIGTTIRSNEIIFLYDRDKVKFLYTNGDYTIRDMKKSEEESAFIRPKKSDHQLYAVDPTEKNLIFSIFTNQGL